MLSEGRARVRALLEPLHDGVGGRREEPEVRACARVVERLHELSSLLGGLALGEGLVVVVVQGRVEEELHQLHARLAGLLERLGDLRGRRVDHAARGGFGFPLPWRLWALSPERVSPVPPRTKTSGTVEPETNFTLPNSQRGSVHWFRILRRGGFGFRLRVFRCVLHM